MDNLIWYEQEGKIGEYQLETYINPNDNKFKKLIHYDYEECYTYEVAYHKDFLLFVIDNKIKAIQCGDNCYFENTNIIGLSYVEVSKILNISINQWENDKGYRVFVDDFRKIRLYEVDHKIRWLIIHSW